MGRVRQRHMTEQLSGLLVEDVDPWRVVLSPPLALSDEEQRLREHRRSAAAPQHRQIEAGERRMVLRTVAVRRHPEVLAGVQVDRGHPPPGRLDQGQPLRTAGRGEEGADVVQVGTRRIGFAQRMDADRRRRRHVEDTGFGIDRGARPVRAAASARQHQRAGANTRRREQRPHPEARSDLLRLGQKLRREVDQVVLADALAIERRRLRRKRLGRRRPFAGHVRFRHRALLDRPHFFPGHPIEDVGERLLRYLRQRLDLAAVHRDVDELRRGRKVVVPQPVMDGLEVPHPLAGVGVEADDALREQVVAEPVAAVEVVRRRRDRQVDVAKFLVDRHHVPDVRVAAVLPGVVLPCVDAVLALLRNRVEDPLHLAGAHVVAADVSRRRRLTDRTVADDGSDHDRVADDGRRRAVGDRARVDPAPEVGLAPFRQQVDLAVDPEAADGLPGQAVDRDQSPVVGGQEDPRFVATAAIPFDRTAPGRNATMLEADVRRPAGPPGLGIVGPERLAARGVDRRRLGDLGRDVDHAVQHDGHRLELTRFDPRVRFGHGRRRRYPLPGDLEFLEVRPVDLLECRVLRVVRPAAEGGPLDHGAGVLRADGWRQRQNDER